MFCWREKNASEVREFDLISVRYGLVRCHNIQIAVFKKLYPDRSLFASGLAAFQRQETIFVGLNLLLLGILLCAHSIFGKYWGAPDSRLVVALVIAFLVNAAELAWLQVLSEPLSMRALAAITWASILGNLTIAFFLCIFSNSDDSPYYVLMIVPILQAAFRFPIGILSAVVTLAGFLNFLWVWYYFQRHQPLGSRGVSGSRCWNADFCHRRLCRLAAGARLATKRRSSRQKSN